MAVVKPKKRLGSKKTKKAWRKTDIEDVEDFLEDQRLEERLGAPFQERPDDELFVLDTAPSGECLEKSKDIKRLRREKILSQPPQCYQVLQSYTKVPDPIAKRNRSRTAEERKHPLLVAKEAERKAKGILKAKEVDQKKNRQIAKERRRNKPKKGEYTKDIWEDNSITTLPPDLSSDWVPPSVKKHILDNTGMKNKAIKLKKAPRKPYVIPAIEAPHPGISYNPSYTEHVALMEQVVEKEVEHLKKEEHLKRVTTGMFQKVPAHVAQAEWMKEMSQGVPDLDPQAAQPDDDPPSDDEVRSINPPVKREKKKDLKKRRIAREENLKRAQRKLSKIEKKKLSDIYRLRQISQDLTRKEAKSQELHKKLKEKKARKVLKTKRLGRNRFEEKDLEYNSISELKGNLRSLKPKGNLLADRFNSMQKRNIMEVSQIQFYRAPKTKRFAKAVHKMDWEINPYERQGRERKKLQEKQLVLGIKHK